MVRPVPAPQLSRRARRPRYSVLGSERVEALGLAPLRAWEKALAEVFATWTAR